MIQKTQLNTAESIIYFVQHWQYGHDYKNTTVLVDPAFNIIAFNDRGTDGIDVVQSDLPFDGDFIIANGEGIDTKNKVKFSSHSYERLYKEWKGGERGADWSVVLKDLRHWNSSYFNSLSLNGYEKAMPDMCKEDYL